VSLSPGTGSIGTSASPIQTSVTNNLDANTGGSGNVYLLNSGATILQASSAGGTLQVTSAGSLNVKGNAQAPTVRMLTSLGSNSGIIINATVGQAGGNTTIIADGSGTITRAGGPSVVGASITLQSTTGSIGTAGAPIKTLTTGTITSSTGGSGQTHITNTGAGVTVAKLCKRRSL